MSPENEIRLLLFGTPRIELNGVVFSLPQREALLHLFTWLALQPNTPHSRKSLAFSLWRNSSEAEALANLRRHLYLLRKAFPMALRSALHISTQHVSLNLPPNTWIDVVAFEQLAVLEPETAATLYTGEIAQGIDGDDAIAMRREELRSRYLELLFSLAQSSIEEEDYRATIRWAQKLMLLDPWNEEIVRLYMIAEYRLGNRSAALALYKTLEENLKKEIGAAPMPETMILYRDILENRLLPATHRTSAPSQRFISRAGELTVLQQALFDIQQKQSKFIFISGPAGVGKTTLVREAMRKNTSPESVYMFWGNCQPTETDRPYALWRQIFNLSAPLLARQAERSAEWLGHLLPLVPDLALLRPNLIPAFRPNSTELHSALLKGLYTLASDRPLVLVIEDAHWIDAASLEFLNELGNRAFQYPILLLITHRTEDPLPLALLDLKRTLRKKRISQDLPLKAFTVEETQAFLKQNLNAEEITHEILMEVSEYAQGIPLLLNEAAQILRQRRQMRMDNAMPSLRDSFRIRLQNLSPPAREMLEAAAILGYSLSDNELRETLRWQPNAYANTLDVLQSERLLLENTPALLDDYSFPHHLIHQIIAQEIPQARAQSIHANAAKALEQIYKDKTGFAAEIASHYEQAAMLQPAARLWLRHAQENIDLAVFDSALHAIAHAEDLLTHLNQPVQELQAQATLQRGVIAFYQGQGEAALSLLQQAVAQSRPFPALFANALSMQAYALYSRDQSKDAYISAEQALTLSLSLNDIPNAVRALNIRSMSALMLGQTEIAIADLQQALSMLEENHLSTSGQTIQSLNHLGTALVFAQDYVQAREILTRTIQLANEAGLRRLEAAALTMLGQIALNCGQYPESIQIYDRAIETAGSTYLPGLWGKFAGRGWAHARSGNLSAARKDFTQGIDVATQVESRYGQILMRSYLTFTALALGELPPASFIDLEKESSALALHPVTFFTANSQALLWRILGDEEKSQSAHTRAVQAAYASNVPSFIQMARLQETLTHAIQAKQIDLNQLEELRQSAMNSGEVPLQILANLAQAHYAFHACRMDEAFRLAQVALEQARACPEQQMIGECLLLIARLYTNKGKEDQAQARYAEVRALADSTFAPLKLCLPNNKQHAIRDILLKSLS